MGVRGTLLGDKSKQHVLFQLYCLTGSQVLRHQDHWLGQEARLHRVAGKDLYKAVRDILHIRRPCAEIFIRHIREETIKVVTGHRRRILRIRLLVSYNVQHRITIVRILQHHHMDLKHRRPRLSYLFAGFLMECL